VNSCLVQLGQTYQVARCARSSFVVWGREGGRLLTLVRFLWVAHQSLYHGFDLREEWKRRGVAQTGKMVTHMVGPTKLEGERVDDLLNLELLPASGPENERWEETDDYSAFPSLLRS